MTRPHVAAFSLLCVVIGVVLIVLAVRDPASNAATITTLVGLLGLAMTNLMTSSKVDRLETTIKNGGTTKPMQDALASDPGRTAIKQAVTEALHDNEAPR